MRKYALRGYTDGLAPFFADFDGDNFVGSSDIEHAVKLLTQNELAMDEIESIWEKVRSGESAKSRFNRCHARRERSAKTI